jgi:hypothetical protein
MKTVAFVYGWSEGAWQSKKFRKLLKTEGYQTIKDPVQANIVVAHSAGCYLVPKNLTATKIILIGLPFWPGRSLTSSAFLNTVDGLRGHRAGGNFNWWLNKLLHNLWYVLTRPQSSYFIFTRLSAGNLPQSDRNRQVLLIRNQKDTFCHQSILQLLPETKSYRFIEQPGDHEDCWLNPQPYVKLLS